MASDWFHMILAVFLVTLKTQFQTHILLFVSLIPFQYIHHLNLFNTQWCQFSDFEFISRSFTFMSVIFKLELLSLRSAVNSCLNCWNVCCLKWFLNRAVWRSQILGAHTFSQYSSLIWILPYLVGTFFLLKILGGQVPLCPPCSYGPDKCIHSCVSARRPTEDRYILVQGSLVTWVPRNQQNF